MSTFRSRSFARLPLALWFVVALLLPLVAGFAPVQAAVSGDLLAATPASIDLSTYVRIGRYNLPVPSRTTAPTGSQLALEVSTVTYNPSTYTLFVLGDEGTAVVQVSKTGRIIDSMTLTAGDFDDPEGLTHVSGSQFVLVEERERQANRFTYVAGGTLSRADVQSVKLGTTVGNIGLEGISLDPQTGGFILVKETTPQGIFQTNIDFAAGTASNGSPTTENATNLFDPSLAGLTDIADVYALSNLPAPLTDANLLVLSQEDGRIVNIDRTGTIANSLTIASDPDNPLNVASQGFEGVTMDDDGLLYIVGEQGGGDGDHPQLWVYAPASYVYANAAPVEVSLSNVTTSLPENSSTAAPVKVGTIIISDDMLGSNTLSLSGADAAAFEIVGTGLFLKAGTALDFETKSSYAATVNVDDASVGTSPDASTTFTLEIIDTTDTPTTLIVSEVAPWSSGNSPGVAADWFEVTNVSASAVDITGWRIDDDSASFANSSALSGVTSIAPGQSAIFVDGDANTITAFVKTWFGGTLPTGVAIGTYGGPGLGTGGDAVNLFDASGTLVTGVTFGASPSASPFASFDNAAGLAAVSTLSVVGVNGAFSVIDVGANEAAVLIGSPGTISGAPVSATQVGVAATDAAAAEEDQNPGTFTFRRTGDSSAALVVSYSVGGSATNGSDYTPNLSGLVEIPAGATSVTITITPVDDSLAEAAESVTLTLVDTANYDIAANAASATVTIADNDSALADFNLQVTEIWPGNSVGSNLTADWFEITNSGTEAWVSGVAPALYYDDDSQSPVEADVIGGIPQIDPGESVVVVIGNAADAQTFASVWGSVIDLTGVDIGYTAGAGLGANGDGVSLFVGLPGTGSVPADYETYPAGSVGQSYDIDLAAFSVAGQNGAVATAPNGSGQPAVGSPGRVGGTTLASNLTIIKAATPAAAWLDWEFTGSGSIGNFTLDNDPNSNTPDRQTFEVVAGTYTITETNKLDNWDLEITCNINGSTVKGTAVTVDVAAGADVTCTFANKRKPQIQITKYDDSNGNGQRDNGELGVKDWQMFLYIDNGNGGWTQIQPREVRTNAQGVANYTSLEPGVDHLVCEEDRAGWLTSAPANPIEHDGKICQVVENLVYGEVRAVSFGNYVLYRARQVGARVWIERNIALAGLGDFDSGDANDGWALVGRTNGAGDNGELRGFFVEEVNGEIVPYAIVFNYSRNKGNRCILLTPKSLNVVKKGQTRMMTSVDDSYDTCPATQYDELPLR